MRHRQKFYNRHAERRTNQAQEILDMIPVLPWKDEEKVLTFIAHKLGSRGKPLFEVEALEGPTRLDRIRDAIRRGVHRRGVVLTRIAAGFAVQTVTK